MMYLGDFIEDATVYIPFTTNASDGTRTNLSASLEEADIVVLKNGAAMTLDANSIVISTSLGSRVGFHVVAIDMSVDADFTTGAEYAAVLYPSDETVDSKAPVGVLATWSCLNRTANVTRWNGTAVPTPDTAGYPKVTIKSGTGTGEIKLSAGYVAPNWGDVGNPTTTVGLSGTTVKTATDIATQISALNNLSQANVRTAVGLANANLDTQLGDLPTAAENATVILGTQLTETYHADGDAPSITQAVLLIMQRLTEFAINGTTITIKKLDGSTTAATLTTDSATAPTSSTRAT